MANNVRHRSDVDPVLSQQIDALQTQAKAEALARLQGNQSQWMMPAPLKWDGDLTDFEGMAAMFDRTQANAWFEDATTSGDSPGDTGDLIVTTTMIDYLACMERAFRARHTMGRTRAMCHAMARKAGHGADRSPLVKVREYIVGLNQAAKNAAGGGQ